MKSKIALIGATGKTGRRVAQRLTDKNIFFRAGSRNAAIPFDWNDQSTWLPFLNGMDKVYITFQPDLAVPGADEAIGKLVSVAYNQRVKHLVLLSGRGEPEAQACEQLVIQSGLQWTIIRADWFMENFSEGFFVESILAGQFIIPDVKALEPFVSADDIADVVVKALTEEGHHQKIYTLSGPELLSFEKVVRLVAEATGRPIEFAQVPIKEYTTMLRSYGVPDDYISLIQYLFTEVMDGRNESLTSDVARVLGRKPTSIEEYIARTREVGVWNVSTGMVS